MGSSVFNVRQESCVVVGQWDRFCILFAILVDRPLFRLGGSGKSLCGSGVFRFRGYLDRVLSLVCFSVDHLDLASAAGPVTVVGLTSECVTDDAGQSAKTF